MILVGVDEDLNAGMLRSQERFYGPAGYGMPDDVDIFSQNAEGLCGSAPEWLILERGLPSDIIHEDGDVEGLSTSEVSGGPGSRQCAGRRCNMAQIILGKTVTEEAAAFLLHEARLLDKARILDWHRLFADEVHYWIPIDESRPASECGALINDNALALEERVYHLLDTTFAAQTPKSRTLHFVSNVQVNVETTTESRIVVDSYQLIIELRTGDYGWLVLLRSDGLVNKALIGSGLVSEPLPLIYNFTGTLIGMVHYMLPLFVLPTYAAMRDIDANTVRAAASMGASLWHSFWTVILPLSLGGIFSGGVIVFIYTLGFFITPAILGGGKVAPIAIRMERTLSTFQNWGAASALGVLLLVLVAIVAATLLGAMRLLRRRRIGG